MHKFCTKEGQEIDVPLERWMWAVAYKDGSELHQFDGENRFHQIGEVVQDNVKMFTLYQPNMEKRIDLIVPEGARLIHKYRHYVMNASTAAEQRYKVYVFGYKIGEHYHYNFIMPSDVIIQSTTDDIPLSSYGLES